VASSILSDNGVSSGSAGLKTSADSTGALALQTTTAGGAATTAVTIDTSQNVTFAGKVTSAGALTLASNGTTTAVTIDTSQKVGIGTTSPTGILNVKGTGGDALPATSGSTQSAGLITRLQQGGGIGSVMDIGGNGGTGSWIQVTEPSNLATNYNLMLNPNGGNLLVGQTSTTQSSKFAVTSSGVNTTYFTNSGAGGYNIVYDSVSNGGTYYFADFRKSGTGISNITSNGTTISYNTGSDYRLKDNIQPITNALNKVAQLKPCKWDWKQFWGQGSSQGFIAHELAEIVPDCVTGEKDAVDDEGNPRYQGVDTSFLVATLTAAIQELKAINDTQAETLTQQTEAITALTARIVALEAK